MATHLTKKDKMFIVLAILVLAFVTIAGWFLVGQAAFVAGFVLAVILLLTITIETYRRVRFDLTTSLDRTYQQIDALFSIFFTIKPEIPFPSTRDWAASPDILNEICKIMFTKKPELVVEASSGVSTLVIAHCLKRIGRGKVVSLEHDPKYAAISRDNILLHGLADVATVELAPLTDVEIGGRIWRWYDLKGLQLDRPIDLLVIDGPPAQTQPQARYPALPVLRKHLAKEAVVVLDDGSRQDERMIVDRWNTEFGGFSTVYLPLEKGAFVLSFGKASGESRP